MNFCEMSFNSPIDNVLNTYNELALRASVFEALGRDTTQSVPYYEERTRRYWLMDEWWACLAFGLAIAGTIIIPVINAALNWGTWRVAGCSAVTMSPVEISKMLAPEITRGTIDLEERRGWLARLTSRRADVASVELVEVEEEEEDESL
ncbi:hypothetical protein QBC32DRAFT_387709 [Pseudoneurospora amorphoporcata]|uniref:Uncharacterized protein n=1 Tax=Pseudoneurospora amorphoporcata TaxID=241081 RepID=A0AAN6NJ89_9PEZI|nr:hypothetical protein QBC32DRAFT_387709 [Pseudoneurospora amorphoporcata]